MYKQFNVWLRRSCCASGRWKDKRWPCEVVGLQPGPAREAEAGEVHDAQHLRKAFRGSSAGEKDPLMSRKQTSQEKPVRSATVGSAQCSCLTTQSTSQTQRCSPRWSSMLATICSHQQGVGGQYKELIEHLVMHSRARLHPLGRSPPTSHDVTGCFMPLVGQSCFSCVLLLAAPLLTRAGCVEWGSVHSSVE